MSRRNGLGMALLIMVATITYVTVTGSNRAVDKESAGCMTQQGEIRIIDVAVGGCDALETALTWSGLGLVEPQAPAGADGAPGSAGRRLLLVIDQDGADVGVLIGGTILTPACALAARCTEAALLHQR